MPRKRAHSAPLALTLDGSLLLNASTRLDATTLARIAAALGVKPHEFFIGLPLADAQRRQALERIDDAAAEVAARIQAQAGTRVGKAPRKRK